MTTHVEQVQRIGRAWGYPNVTESEADTILWEFTGFPTFFHTRQPHRELRRQLRAFFRAARERGDALKMRSVVLYVSTGASDVAALASDRQGWFSETFVGLSKKGSASHAS